MEIVYRQDYHASFWERPYQEEKQSNPTNDKSPKQAIIIVYKKWLTLLVIYIVLVERKVNDP